MEAMRSGVILSGGSGSRLGTEKSLLPFCGRPLIQRIVKRLLYVVDEIVIVTRNDKQAEVLRELIPEAHFACDCIKGYGPVAGLAIGMACAKGDYAFASGCDLPFLSVPVIDKLFELAVGYDAAVPIQPKGYMETLHSVYRREKMRDACERAIARGDRRISAPLSEMKLNLVPVEVLRPLDPELLTFFNVNTKDDLEAALKLCREDYSSSSFGS
ncbi:MAG: molybdenum cofactor guanylyltransferase [Methanotrichaceae archaeon]